MSKILTRLKEMWEDLSYEVSFFKLGLVIYAIIVTLVLFGARQNVAVLKQNMANMTPVAPPADYSLVENEVANLRKKNKELLDAITYLESKGDTVKTITKIQTVVTGGETKYKVMPSTYTFRLDNGMAVADFKAEDEYKFTTADLELKTTVLVSDDETLVKVTGRSSLEDKEFILPTEVITQRTSKPEPEEKLFDPRIAIGAGVSFPLTGPEVVIALPLLEDRTNSWSFVAPTFTVSEQPKIGLTPVMYNVGKPVPLLDNVWLGIGYETDIVNHYVVGTLTAKL